jgi:hypothetical protein
MHPGPTGTNHFWSEEIAMGPGPPPRRAKRSNTGNNSQRGMIGAGVYSNGVSRTGSSLDINQTDAALRLSEDTVDDDNWNRKRYQREDEELWGFGDSTSPTRATTTRGSSVGLGGIIRPGTSKSSAESYRTARVPPVNDLHPPIVSMPSAYPLDNHWMLQPPPKASIMSGKERATNRSRSGSSASSRVELSLQRQVSTRQLKQKLERGLTPDLPPPIFRGNSHRSVAAGQRLDRPKTPQARPPSTASSRKSKQRRDTVFTTRVEADHSSGDSGDTLMRVRGSDMDLRGFKGTLFPDSSGKRLSSNANTPRPTSASSSPDPSLPLVRVRGSRQRLSTVISSGSGNAQTAENAPTRLPKESSTASSDSTPYLLKHRAPLISSDSSSLNVLQDVVSSQALLSSRFVSAPLIEARVRLPPSNQEEEKSLTLRKEWVGSGFGVSRGWRTDNNDTPVPFDSLGVPERDPRMRWSVDF